MKAPLKKNSPIIILVALGLILITLVGACSTPHHGSGNKRNHMTNSMGG